MTIFVVSSHAFAQPFRLIGPDNVELSIDARVVDERPEALADPMGGDSSFGVATVYAGFGSYPRLIVSMGALFVSFRFLRPVLGPHWAVFASVPLIFTASYILEFIDNRNLPTEISVKDADTGEIKKYKVSSKDYWRLIRVLKGTSDIASLLGGQRVPVQVDRLLIFLQPEEKTKLRVRVKTPDKKTKIVPIGKMSPSFLGACKYPLRLLGLLR